MTNHLHLHVHFEEIDITQKTVFDHISKHQDESLKYNVQQSIFDEPQGVW